MNTAHFLFFSILLTGAGSVYADNTNSGRITQPPSIPSLAVKQRLQAIEQIHVTSQKIAQPLDDVELQAIIDAAQRLEDEPEQMPSARQTPSNNATRHQD